MEQELVPSARPMTSCPVLKLFTGQMAGSDVTRLRTEQSLANMPFPLSPDHLLQLCILLKNLIRTKDIT